MNFSSVDCASGSVQTYMYMYVQCRVITQIEKGEVEEREGGRDGEGLRKEGREGREGN